MGSLMLDVIFSALGTGYFIYGKKLQDYYFLLLGLCLMFYSYFIGDVVLKLLIGIALSYAPFLLKKFN